MDRAPNLWTGSWEWNSQTAKFTDPQHENLWKSQTLHVDASRDHLRLEMAQAFLDGSERVWTLDSAFDGIARPIIWADNHTTMAMISYLRMSNEMIGDAFFTEDGAFAGSEYFTVGADNVQVWGSNTRAGEHYLYFEEWSRL
jgi:hypothetical protein